MKTGEVTRAYCGRANDRCAQDEGQIDAGARPKDAARNLVALTQGMALMGRVSDTPTVQRSIVRAALHGLRP